MIGARIAIHPDVASNRRIWKSHALIPIFSSMAINLDFVKRLTRLRINAIALGNRTMELLKLVEVLAKREC